NRTVTDLVEEILIRVPITSLGAPHGVEPVFGTNKVDTPARTTPYNRLDTYALGYDNNSCNHKILRYIIDYGEEEFEIYDFKSDSWRTLDLDVTPDWGFEYVPYSTSLKGNTYFVDYDRFDETTNNYFICFDFTRERFGQYLQLPWSRDNSYYKSTPISSFGEEKLSALYMGGHISGIGIWVTTKIEPNEVFFIDEDTKRAVLFSVDWHDSLKTEEEYYNAAYIIGKNDFFKSVDLGATNPLNDYVPAVCPNSYVPSLVQIKQNCMERQEEEAGQEARS
ncbi:hypothetical protein HID58_059653, partial [Brassica napus]